MTLRNFSQTGNTNSAIWGDGNKFASILSGHRGGCLFSSEIKVWERGTGRAKTIASTMGVQSEQEATEENLIRYIESIWAKHLG